MLGILFVICFSIFIALNYRKLSVSEVIPTVYLSIIVFLCPFYCLNHLRLGRGLIIFFFFLLLSLSVYRLFKEGIHFIEHANIYPIIGYLLIILAIVLMTKDNYVWLWDSTRLWGAAPKAIYYTERLQLGPDALVYPFMQSYPPGMPLLVYFLESFSKPFSEWQIYLIYGAFVSSFFLPAIKHVSKKSVRYLPLLCLLILLMPCVTTSNGGDFSYFYNSLFIDSVLGALFGYGIYLSTETDYRDFVSIYRLAVVLTTLTMLKDSGALFALILLALSMSLYYQKKSIKTRREIILSLCALLSAVVPWRLWAMLVKHYNVSSFNAFPDNNGLNGKAIISLINKSISMPSILYKSRWEAICISFSLVIVLLMEMLSIYSIAKKIDKFGRRMIATIITLLSISYLLFLLGFGLTYGEELPSFQRYTSTLTIAPLVFLFIVLANHFLETKAMDTNIKHTGVRNSILLFACIIVIDTLAVWDETTNQSHICPYESVKEQSDYILSSVLKDRDTDGLNPADNVDLYLMYTGNPGENCLEAQRLYLNLIGSGIRLKNNYMNMRVIDWDYYDEDHSNIALQETFQLWNEDLVRNYDYIYIYQIDERTQELFFDETSVKLENQHLYRIDNSKQTEIAPV